ncbi:MAG: alpha/beta hydrolase [Actinobacteria bacterium]|nr:alpha/beta hydrolase [Actinomycetota bacterium]
MDTVSVGGRTIAYRRAGEGPPLVLLHGAWSDSREWRAQLEGLSDGHPGTGSPRTSPASSPARSRRRPSTEMVTIMGDVRPGGTRPMVKAFAEADLREVARHFSVPTLLLYGELDVRAPVAVAEDLHSRVPHSELVVMPGVGHVCNIEAPVSFNAEVRRFLRSVTG